MQVQIHTPGTRPGSPAGRRRPGLARYAPALSLALLLAAPCARAQVSDLSLAQTVSDPAPAIGSQLTFQVTIANAGPNAAQRVVVRDRVPAGYAYVSHVVSRGTYTPGNGRWSGFGLTAAGSATLTIVATVQPSGNRYNVAEILSSTSSDPDSTPGNGDPAEDDYARVTTTPVPANVPPVITAAVPLATPEETALTITLADLTVSDPDDVYPEDFTLSVQAGPGYALGAANDIVPDAQFNGVLAVPVTVSDGTDSSAPFDVPVTVTPVNDVPAITGAAALVTRTERPLSIRLADLAVQDPDGVYPDDFSLSVHPGAGYEVSGPGEITPAAGFVGALSVAITVNDGLADSAPFGAAVTVTGPNVVVVMADDLDLRSLNDLLHAGLMPNLQAQVIDRGLTFTESYSTDPLCCPSRATFLTGQYMHNHGIASNGLLYSGYGFEGAVGQFDDSQTLATRLQALGYTTGYVGKYLHGYGEDAALAFLSPAFDPEYVPPGWSSWNALVDPFAYCMYNYTISHDGVPVDYLRPQGLREDSTSYQTNVLATVAEGFVLAHRDDREPFFLYVSPLAPHGERCADAYGGTPPPGDDEFQWRVRPAPEDAEAPVPAFVAGPAYDEDVSDKPYWIASLAPLTATDATDIAEQYTQRLRAMLAVDRLLGRIVNALGERLDETVLVFTSDNGWLYGEHRRGGKIYAYRESARVPLFVAGPGAPPGARADLVLNNDLAPTLLDLAAPGYSDEQFDGRSFAPLLRQAEPPGWIDRVQFLIEIGRTANSPIMDLWPTYFALRTATTLYIESYAGTIYSAPPLPLSGLELYDLTNDPAEMESLLRYPEDARDPLLGPWLDLLRGCAGATCRQYENLQNGP